MNGIDITSRVPGAMETSDTVELGIRSSAPKSRRWSLTMQCRLMAKMLVRRMRSDLFLYRVVIRSQVLKAEALDDVFKRTWFERAWTLQELVLASEVVFLCGTKSMTWDEFVRGISSLRIRKKRHFSTTSPAEFGVHHRVVLIYNLVILWGMIPRPSFWHAVRRRAELTWRLKGTATMRDYLDFFESRLRSRLYLFIPTILWRIIALCPALLLPSFIGVGLFLKSECVLDIMFGKGSSCFIGTAWFYFLVIGGICILLSAILTVLCDWNKILSPHDKTQPDIKVEGIARAIQHRRATEARDKSYAIYGILKSLTARPFSTARYDKPLSTVYRELFSDLLTCESGFIRLLSGAGIQPLPETPSWVPN